MHTYIKIRMYRYIYIQKSKKANSPQLWRHCYCERSTVSTSICNFVHQLNFNMKDNQHGIKVQTGSFNSRGLTTVWP